MELKVQCDCGQKYKFDVEPVNGQMPFRVSCPICGIDGTDKANTLLRAQAPAMASAPPPPPGGLRLGIAPPPPPAAAAPPMPMGQRFPAAAGVARGPLGPAAAPRKAAETTNLGLGILGAILGAGLGAGLMYVFFAVVGFRFPLMGTGTGILTGLGARILYRGTDSALGAISGGIAAAAVVAAIYFMYGEFRPASVITAVIGIYFAYRIAA